MCTRHLNQTLKILSARFEVVHGGGYPQRNVTHHVVVIRTGWPIDRYR